MKKLIFLFCFILHFTAFSQEMQWASSVLGYSSERSEPMNQGPEYRAKQILGRPNKLPSTGECKCAWSPSGADTFAEEWIKVGFEKPQRIKQVSIAENFNPGAIVRVSAFDSLGKEYLLKDISENMVKVAGRMNNIIVPLTDYKVAAIKILMIPNKVKGHNQIDAIGISDSDKPYEATINLAKSMPAEIIKESVGKTINTKYREVAPIITPDGKTLYFTREGHDQNIGKDKRQDVWVSRYNGGLWSEAENLGSPINTDSHNAISTISADGKNVYLVNIYLPDGSFKQGLSRSKRINSGWEFPKEVKINDYINYGNYSEFSLSPDGKTLVMACKRNETFGDKDLYVSFLKKDGSWSKPVNMGSDINTVESESTPFVAADNKTLYFSTQGLAGFGDNDIFVTRRLDSTWTKWSEPENLGSQINTAKWDGYFTIPASGEYAYLSSEEKSIGSEDIFRIKLFPSIKPEPVAIISGTVVNAMDKKPLAADVVLEILGDTSKNNRMNAEFDPETGEYKLVVPLKKIYTLNATKKGFISISDNIDLSKERSFREIKRNINMIPVQEGQKMVLNNLFFEQSKFEIKPESFPELDRIIELMNEFPSLEILLEGHTQTTPNDDEKLNLKLSDDRVKEVKKYLTEKGNINVFRIQTKAWGGSRPIASNQTEETRKKNRRVEFTILKL